MSDKRLFKDVPAAPPGLVNRILLRIEREERRQRAIKTILFGALFVASVSVIVYGANAAIAEAFRSGFVTFASLLFTDFSVAASSFSDFAFSILESFPVLSASIFLSGVFFALWSAARLTGEVVLMRRHAFD